ncbi:hypothetical protein D9M70_244250 [compost metagenome]
MVLQQPLQGAFQQGRIQRAGRLQQQRLVPVVQPVLAAVEEPVLDRRQAGLAAEGPLFDDDGLLARAVLGGFGQALHGLEAEQVLGREVDAQLAGTADHLDGEDGVAAQLEEVVVDAHLGKVEHLAPDLRQLPFALAARGGIGLAALLQVRRRQGLAVQLAVGGERHARQQHQVRRHHVVGQQGLEAGLQLFAEARLGFGLGAGQGQVLGQQVAHQLLAAAGIQGQHHGLAHTRQGLQAGFDLAQLDAEAANLHLVVDTADVLDQPVAALAHQVTGAVQASALAAEGVGDEAFGGEAGALVVTTGQAVATHIELTGGARRQQVEVGVQHVERTGAHHLADGHAGGSRFQLFRGQAGQGHHHGFRGAVGVEEALRREGRTDALQVFRSQRLAAGDAQAHRQLLAAPIQPLGQLAAVAGGEAEDGHALVADQPADILRAPLPLGPQYHPRATHQRRQQAFAGGVEVDGIEVQLAVVAAHAEVGDHRLQVHGDGTLVHHHALGLAGGAGGVDDVGEVLRAAARRQVACGVAGQGRAVALHAPALHACGQLAQGVQQAGVAQQQGDAAVFHHVAQAVQRVFRVQRHVGAAGLEDGQQAHHHFQGAFQGQADPHFRPHAQFHQAACQLVGAGVEFGIAEVLAGEGQGQRVRRGGCLALEQQLHGAIQRIGIRALAMGRDQGGALVGGEQRQLGQAQVGRFDHRPQQVLPVLGHARDARPVEQVAAVGQAAAQALVEVGDFQVQVELGGAGVVGDVLQLQPRHVAGLLELPALHVAHHLEQRVVGGAALRLQGFHQVVERQVLVRLGVDGHLAHLLQQLVDAHLPLGLHAQHLGVEEGTDQPFAFRADAVGHRRADAQVVLAAVAIQQHAEGGGHGHEHGQAMFGIEGTHACGQGVVQVEAEQVTGMALHRRTRAVGGQFQQRLLTAQLRRPVVQLALHLPRFQPLAVPLAVVQVLHRQRRQLGLAAFQFGGVELGQFAGEDVHRPAFGDDVVQGHHQVMQLGVGLDQVDPQQRTAFQVEGLVRFDVGKGLQARLELAGRQVAEVMTLDAQGAILGDALQRHATLAGEGGAQGFVAFHQGLQRGFEALGIQPAAHARHAANVVGRAVRLHLPEEPHALLGMRQRHRLAAVDPGDGALAVAQAAGQRLLHPGGEGAEAAGVEQRAQGQLDIEGLAAAGDDLGGQQGMAAEFEEVIAQADLGDAQHLPPDGGQALLHLGLRRHVLALAPLRFGQGLAFQLAGRGQRHCIQAQQVRRHHVLRQGLLQGGLEPRQQLLLALAIGADVAHQLRTGLAVTQDHHGLAHADLGQQAGFDFFQLDAETAQLHLLVDAAEVFQHAVGTPARQVASAVETRAAAVRVGHETLGGKAGAAQVATGQARATDAQFTGHAGHHGFQVLVQHQALHVAQRAADGHRGTLARLAVPVGHVDGGFAGAVAVVQLHRRQLLEHAVAQLGRQRFAAGEQQAQAGAMGQLRLLDEQLQQRRHEVQHAHAVFAHQLDDARRVAVLARGSQHQAAAAEQRQEAFPDGHVEAHRRLLHEYVVGAEAIGVAHPQQALGQGGVGDADALGLAGGAGGVDHVGEVLAVEVQGRCVGGPFALISVQIQTLHAARQVDHIQVALGQQQADAAVFDHVGQALAGVVRVQRHVGAAGLEDGQQAHQQFRRTLGADADPRFRRHAQGAQAIGQAVGAGIQLTQRQRLVAQQQRAFGGDGDLLGDQFRQPALGALARGAAPDGELGALGVAQQLHVTDGEIGLLRHLPEQALQVGGQARDGGFVEQLHGVVEGQADAPALVFLALQLQLELGLQAVPRQLLGGEAGQALQGTVVALLVVEQHLEQAALGAGLGEGLQQLLEGQFLMRLGAEGGLARLGQQLAEGRASVQFATQHQGIDEEADQALGFQARAVGAGHAEADVLLPAVAVQQRLPAGQQQHEQAGVLLAGDLLQTLGQGLVQTDAVAAGAVAGIRHAGTVGGQQEQRLLFSQLRLPPIQLALTLARRQPLVLPGGEVGVLQRQRLQRRVLAEAEGAVEAGEFVQQQVQRPAVGNDVVQGHQQQVVALGDAHQGDAQQRALLQVEGRQGFGFTQGQGVGFGVRLVFEVDQFQLEVAGRVDALHRLAVHFVEAGAQGFVALHQQLEALFQGGLIEAATQAQGAGNVVGGALRVQLPEEPEAVLCGGLGQRLAAIETDDSALGLPAFGGQALHQRGEFAEGRRFEQVAHFQGDAQLLAQAGHDLHGADGVAAQGEEVVGGAELGHFQLFAPEPGHQAVGGCGGRLARLAEGFAFAEQRVVVEAAVVQLAAAGGTLQLAAGGLGQRAGIEQDDHRRAFLMGLGHGLADHPHQHVRWHHLLHAAADLGGDADALAALVLHGEGGDAALAHHFHLRLDGALDVLRVEVVATDDEHVLQAAGDVQFATQQEAQVAGAQPGTAVALDEGARAGFGVVPVAEGDAGAADPDLAHLAFTEGDAVLRVHQQQRVLRLRIAAADGDGTAAAFGPVGGQCVGVQLADVDALATAAAGDEERGLGQAVAGEPGAGVEAAGAVARGEGVEAVLADRFGTGEGQAPAGQVEARQGGFADPLAAQAVGEVRPAADGAAEARDGFQPAHRAF